MEERDHGIPVPLEQSDDEVLRSRGNPASQILQAERIFRILRTRQHDKAIVRMISVISA